MAAGALDNRPTAYTCNMRHDVAMNRDGSQKTREHFKLNCLTLTNEPLDL